MLRLSPYLLWLHLFALAVWLCHAIPSVKAAEPAKATANSVSNTPLAAIEEKWGIKLASLRLTGRGMMVDFRYQVVDPDKAATLAKHENKPVLTNLETGDKIYVPSTAKLGPLRQAGQKPEAGRIYWMFFSNRMGVVKPGSKVTIQIGDFKVENLTVEGT